MPATNLKNVARLARLARDLERKRALCLDFQRHLEAVEALGVVVAGERAMLDERLAELATASRLVEQVERARQAGQAAILLTQAEEILSAPEWEVADLVCGELAAKDKALSAEIRNYAVQIQDWQARVEKLVEVAQAADRERAPVDREQFELRALRDKVKEADRALREQQFAAAADALRQLANLTGRPAELQEQIQTKAKQAKPFARQAELLLQLHRPPAGERFEYTVLLRTPGRPGAYGLSIQGTSTLSPQDHDGFARTLDVVRTQINLGLARDFAARRGAATAGEVQPEAEAAAPPGAPPAGDGHTPGGEDEGDETRSLLPAHRALAGPLPLPVNDLVRKVGDRMFRLLIPEQMQPYLAETPCSLTITSNDLELPWELMWAERAPQGFLCLDRPVARMPMGRALPRRETTVNRAEKKLRFLLIYADPVEPAGSLPAAGREVEEIRTGLSNEWGDEIEIETLWREEAQGQRLNEALLNGEYDVIHYAGHATFDRGDPDLSGLLLHGREVFFAQKVRRLLEGRPLVFLNACESGRTANEDDLQQIGLYLQGPAEGLASSFIYGGAAGCIGALWPVYDEPARQFALRFYNHVVEGHMIGEAMRLARLHSLETYPTQITWASFVLYGDPTYQLR